MRRLGLIGGMAWPSTEAAHRRLNQGVAAAIGGVASAPLVIWSFDFAEIEALQAKGDWDGLDHMMADAAAAVVAAGAEGLMICTNTMHRCVPAIESVVDVPVLHIADATAAAVQQAGVSRVGLLGTKYTMQQDFYVGRLRDHGLDVVVPQPSAQDDVHRIIYEELVLGIVRESSRRVYRSVVDQLVEAGATGVIAGCTEIELLLGSEDVSVPWFPTTEIHVDAALDWILER